MIKKKAIFFDRDGVLNKAIIKDKKPNVIIHCAGLVGGIQANILKPYSFLSVNLGMGLNIVECAIENKIEWIANPSDEALAKLYKNASLFLFPSRYEGFGWPPLEAQSYAIPVVCSDAASLPEVVKNSALTANAEDITTLSNHCLEILLQKELADDLRAKGLENIKRFSKENFQKELQEIYAHYH